MVIRLAKEQDKEQVKALWNYCFYESDPYLSWFFDTIYRPQQTVVAAEGEKVLSAAQFLPYWVKLGGRKLQAVYLAGVSTWPQARGKGAARAVIAYGEQLSKERGAQLALLVPAIDHFYEKLGYRICADKEEYQYAASVPPPGRFRGEIRPAGQEELDDMLALYHNAMSKLDGYILRDKTIMEQIIQTYTFFHGGAYVFYDKGNPVGYVIYSVDSQRICAEEAVYTERAGLDGILWFIYSHGSQAKRALLRLPVGDSAGTLLYTKEYHIQRISIVLGKSLMDVETEVLFHNERRNHYFNLMG